MSCWGSTWTILLAWCIVASTANSADPCEKFHKSYRQLEGSNFAFNETYPSKRSDEYCQIKHRNTTATYWSNVCIRNLLIRKAFHMERLCNESCPPTFDHRMTNVTSMTHTGQLRLLFNARTIDCFNLTVYRKKDLVITVSIPEMDSIRITPDTWGQYPSSVVRNESLTVKLQLDPAAPDSAHVYLESTGGGSDRLDPLDCVGGWTGRVCAVSIPPASTNHNITILSVDLGVNGVPEEYRRIRVLAVGRSKTDEEDAVNVPLVAGLISAGVVVVVVIIALVVVFVRRKPEPSYWLDEFRSEIEHMRDDVDGKIDMIENRVLLLKRIKDKFERLTSRTTNGMNYTTGSDEVEQPLQPSTTSQEYEHAVDDVLSGRINQIQNSNDVDQTDGLADNISELVNEVKRYREVTVGCERTFGQIDKALQFTQELFKTISEVNECIRGNISDQWDFRKGNEHLMILQVLREKLENIKQQLDTIGRSIAGEAHVKYKECQKNINNRREELKKFKSFMSVIEDRELKELFKKDELGSKPVLDEQLESGKERYYEMAGEDLIEEWKTICSLALAYQSISKTSEDDVCYQVDFRLLRVFGDKNRVVAVQPPTPLPEELRAKCCRMTRHLLQSKKEDEKSGVLSFVVRFWTELDLQEPQNKEFPNWEAAKAFLGQDYLTSEEKLRSVLGEQLRVHPGDPGPARIWISKSMLGLWTEDPMFVRALTKAVLDSITDSNQKIINHHYPMVNEYCSQLLCRFSSRVSFCCRVNLKVEMLLAVQEWIEKQNVMADIFEDILNCLKDKNVIGNDDFRAWMADPRNETAQRYVGIVGDIIGNHSEDILVYLRPGEVDDHRLESFMAACREVSKKIATKSKNVEEWMQQNESLQATNRCKGFVKLIVGITCEQVFFSDASIGGMCDILVHYVHTAEQQSEALDALKDISQAHSEHADKIKELFITLFDRRILTTEMVVRWCNQGGVMTDPTSRQFLDKRLETESKTLLDEIEKNHDLANVIEKMHGLVPTRQRLDFGTKAIMRMVRGSYERNKGPGEKFDLLQFHKRVPLLWYITRHNPQIDRAIIEAMKSGRVAGTADLCGSPWYVPLIKTLLFGNALSMAALRDCHDIKNKEEIGYNKTSYDIMSRFLHKLCFHK